MIGNTINSLHKLKDIFFGKKARRIYKILAISFVALATIGYTSALATQSRLEKENTKIIFTDINDEFYLDYNSTSQEIKAKISGVSPIAKAHILDKKIFIRSISEKDAGEIFYKLENLKEGENKIGIRVEDGKRSTEKTIIIKRQTKEDYDRQELEKAINRVEELLKRAEEENSDENVSNARADLDRLPEDKREQFKNRIEKLESIVRERKEKERIEEEKRKQEEEERKIQEEKAKKAEEERREQERIDKERAEAEERKRQETQNNQSTPVAAPAPQSEPANPTQNTQPAPVHPVPVPTPTTVPVPAPAPSPAPVPAPQPQTNNLPLKAICRDGTVSYQDSPALNTYRGMCSGHKGIKQRLGRVP